VRWSSKRATPAEAGWKLSALKESVRLHFMPTNLNVQILVAAAIGFLPAYPALTQSVGTPPTPQTAVSGMPASAPISTIVVEGTRIQSPGISPSGTNDYMISSENIDDLPAGVNTVLTDVLGQLPGVGIDQNQQVHIRDTEGSGFQYQINGVLVPLDINTNPPFISMLNPLFIKRFDLLDGVLPARYSYATGGVVDVQTKDGCEQPGGSATVFGGQRGMIQPSAQYAGCSGGLSYYSSVLYSQSNLAFSSATSGPTPIHDWTNQGQAFNVFSYSLSNDTKVSAIVSVADSDNQLPNVPGLTPRYILANAPAISSAQIDSYLNFRDYLGILSLASSPMERVSYQVSYAVHSISELYEPDNAGELVYQGVASQASHKDLDNTLQGDLTYRTTRHSIGTGFYLGYYDVTADGNSLVFPVNASGAQSGVVPVNVITSAHAMNLLSGIYVNDLWQVGPALRANVGLRRDALTGFSPGNQIDPTLNLSYMFSSGTTLHAGIARYFQVPSFEGISPRAPAAFAGTTGAGPSGVTTPTYESDWEYDAGVVQVLAPGLTISEDNFYEKTRHYLDAGQFGVVPIFAPFNYDHGYIWGSEIAVDYKQGNFSTYENLTAGRNLEKGVVTGQFNFSDPGELNYINSHYIVLDHQPLLTFTAGMAYGWQSYKISVDALYNTGLRSGFANTEKLPNMFQVNLGTKRKFQIAGHPLTNQIALLNIFDRTNLIRPSGGLGVFQSAYGARLTVFDAVTLAF